MLACCAVLLLAASFAPPCGISESFLVTPFGGLAAPDVKLDAQSYPQALPNDGRSEAVITVELKLDGKPLAGVKVKANVQRGDGMLRCSEATTDADGHATFQYRAGILPQPGVVNVVAPDSGAGAEVRVPLAAVSYLDLLLVTPEEYAKHKSRQAAAAPIYKLDVDVFPPQLAADGGSLGMLTARLTFADGKPAPGVPLQAQLASGEGRIETTQKATDSTGRMSFHFTAGRMPGTAVIRVVELSTGLTTTASILLVQAGAARVELLCGDSLALGTPHDGTLLPADGITELPLAVRVTDLSGMPLPGVEVKVEILDQGTGWVEVRDGVSDGRGEIHCSYHAGARTGKLRLRAFAAAGLPAQ